MGADPVRRVPVEGQGGFQRLTLGEGRCSLKPERQRIASIW
jgi:hypothetical protein